MTVAVREHDSRLSADPARVIARLFLPGEGLAATHARAADIIARVHQIPEERLAGLAAEILEAFGGRHRDFENLVRSNARAVRPGIDTSTEEGSNRELLLGACFTAEYAVEGAALCNPSAFPHPDQSGLRAGELRLAVALRQIGEGHISSVGFAEAVIDADGDWNFEDRKRPLAVGAVVDGHWTRDHLGAALEYERYSTELSSTILGHLPDRFTAAAVEEALKVLPRSLVSHRDSVTELEMLRIAVASAYKSMFDADTELSQRVLVPEAAEEDRGIEDARFVRFEHDDGSVEYRATYTAYDGRDIAPRLITSSDLQSFAMHRLTGPAAENKGMALFPRMIGGRHLAVTRTGGERMSLAESADGLVWNSEKALHGPQQPWEIIQVGNCGSPLETDRGWLLLTHGVGPMRKYTIGALLLDLDDPAKVIALTTEPFLLPHGHRQNGYVPNVVYSCGAVIHQDRLWMPYGIGDARIGTVSVSVPDLLDSLTPVESLAPVVPLSRDESLAPVGLFTPRSR